MPEEKKTEKTEPYLGTFADKAAAEAGLANMQTKMTSMGDEVGSLRGQVDVANQTINDLRSKQTQAVSDAETQAELEIAEVQKEILALDDEDSNYHTDMITLMNKANDLSRGAQHEKTLASSIAMFKKELDARDTRAVQDSFRSDNPDFDTPEMQEKIRRTVAKDKTGMSDNYSAFFEVQRDEARQASHALQEENEKLKNLANLAEGTQETGNIVTDDQVPSNVPQTELKGADLDKAMLAAVQAAK